MSHTSKEIASLIGDTLSLFRDVKTAPAEEAPIFGDGGMDSMGLVVFLAELEARLMEKTGQNIVLASERAMSRSTSPFRSVESLAGFIMELLHEDAEK